MKKRWVAIAAAAVAIGGAAPATAQGEPTVTILHGIPGVAVDLRVDGDVVIAGFEPGDTQDLSALAGTELTGVDAVLAGTDEVVIGPIDTFGVPDDGNSTVVVHLAENGQPTLTPFANAVPSSEPDSGVFTVRHVAASAPVSVLLGDREIATGIGNGQESSVELPAGQVTDTWITVDGQRVASVPTLQLDADTQLIVYVGGSFADGNFDFYIQQIAIEPSIEQSDAGGAPADTEEGVAPGDTAEDASDGVGDGTPQPDIVNTGSVIDETSGDPVVLGVGIALLALAALALVVRWRLLAAVAATRALPPPWAPPSVNALVRRADSPFN